MNEDRTHGDSSAINDDDLLPRPPSSEPISFGYTNYRKEKGTRRAIPVRLYWGRTEYHPEEQWLFEAYDVEKHAMRDFALRDCDFTVDHTAQSKLETALNRRVTGIGASYNRNADSWGIYTMPETVPFATLHGWDGIDWTIEALRKHLWHERQPTVIEKLRAAMDEHDKRVSTCPYQKPKPPSSEQRCKECDGTVSTGCFRGANAAGDVVRTVQRILDGDA